MQAGSVCEPSVLPYGIGSSPRRRDVIGYDHDVPGVRTRERKTEVLFQHEQSGLMESVKMRAVKRALSHVLEDARARGGGKSETVVQGLGYVSG